MCLRDTIMHFRVRSASIDLLAGVVAASFLLGYSAFGQISPVWSRVAGTTISEGLAGPASGPVSAAWYAAGASALLAQTESGRIFETTDFIHWRLSTTGTVPSPGFGNAAFSALSLPEPNARIQ